MATIDPAKALTYYQARVGNMLNDIVMRDVAIAELEEQNRTLEDECGRLRVKLHDLTADAGPEPTTDMG